MGVSDQERLAITGDGPREEFIVGMVGCHDSQGVGCVLVYKMGGKVRDLRNVNGMKALNELNHVLLERSRLNLVQAEGYGGGIGIQWCRRIKRRKDGTIEQSSGSTRISKKRRKREKSQKCWGHAQQSSRHP